MTSPPTFPAAGTFVLRLPRSLYASSLILVCYDPTTLVFEHVQNERVRSVVLPDHKDIPRPYIAYEDPTELLLRFVKIGGGGVFEQFNKMLKVFKNTHIHLYM